MYIGGSLTVVPQSNACSPLRDINHLEILVLAVYEVDL